MISAQELRELFDYETSSGRFTSKRSGKSVGWVAVNGYVYVAIRRRKYLAHRLAWLYVHGRWPYRELDHRDGDRANNRIDNLREAGELANSGNRGPNRNNRSGFKGVFRANGGVGAWTAQISLHGKHTHLGCWPTAEAAARAYDEAAIRHYGEFAKTNKMLGLLP